MCQVLIINPILYTSETNNIPRVQSVKDTMIYALCLGFMKEGHQVTLIAAEDYRPTAEEQYDFPILWLKTVWRSIFQPRCFPYMPKLRGYLKKHKEYDYIISSEMFATWSYTAARVCPRKTVVWHELAKHNNMLHKIPSHVWYRMVAAVFMRRITVVPRSKAAADFIRQFSNKVSDTIIDHGVNIEEMTPAGAQEKQNQFVVVSQLIERKRIDKTIDSFAAFWNEGHRDYRLYIIGSGEREEMLKTQVKRLQIEDAVIFCGKLTHEELLPIVSQSKAMLVSTEKDNNMVSIVESIAVGTPVVTTSVPYNAYYINKETLGIVRDDWNEDALKQICGKYDMYHANCIAYRDKLSNVYCVRQFMTVKESCIGS
ncbi:MAG: glycosyltransferase [Lachnospiraceae bacterium]|nr:glycosyltransferase [Lachnospiraceae bacterium]